MTGFPSRSLLHFVRIVLPYRLRWWRGRSRDFTRQLINALPHITVSDERRQPLRQPAEAVYAAAEIRGLTPEARLKGIKNPPATVGALEAWLPGAVAPSVLTKGILRYAGRDVPASITGIDPQREPKVSQLATQMRQGSLTSLYRTSNAMILGDRLAEKIGARVGSNLTLQTTRRWSGCRIPASARSTRRPATSWSGPVRWSSSRPGWWTRSASGW
jgi:ABC-type lipoprotein release transport system permease subunit